MKKLLLLLCCVALLCGCGGTAQSVPAERVYELYFRTADLAHAGGVDAISALPSGIAVNAETEVHEMAAQLMEALLSGPKEPGVRSPFPAGTSMRSVKVSGGHAAVDMSTVYGNLSGVDLTVADYCITLTLTQLAEIRNVTVTVNGQTLAYRGVQTFSARDVLLTSAEDIVATVETELYFVNAEGVLVREPRTLQIYEGDTRAETLVETLLNGPENKELLNPFPEGFAVQSVWVKDGRCYVNLSATMMDALPPETRLELPLQAMASSLLSMRTVQEVQFLLDAEPTMTIGGADVSQLFTEQE